MSRSYKHTPIIKIACGPTKASKRLASKAARHCDLSDGACYKRVFSSYDIWDWKSNFYRVYKGGRSRWTGYPPSMEDIREYWNK